MILLRVVIVIDCVQTNLLDECPKVVTGEPSITHGVTTGQ